MPGPSDHQSSSPRPGRRAPARRTRRSLLVLGATAVAAGLALVASGIGAATAEPTPGQLRDDADARVKSAQARVDQLNEQRHQLIIEGTKLTADQQAVAARLEAARQEAQKFVVSSYISGTGPAVEDAIIYQESTTDLSYKTFFVKDRAKRVRDAVEDQRSAFAEVDARLADFAVRRGDNGTALDRANADLDRALSDLRDADAKIKEAEALARAAAPPPTTRPSLTAPSGGSGPPGHLNARGPGWEKLRQCESTGNYHIKSTYRGAYQFDYKTWSTVGGSGDPADASVDEQDYRAQILFNQRGSSPWPVCGKYLNGDPMARQAAVPPPGIG